MLVQGKSSPCQSEKKYQVLVMTHRNVDKEAKDECTLDIDYQNLKPTANLRILGVNIDESLVSLDT